MRRPRPAGSESKWSKAVSPCGSTCTSRAAPVASRAVTEKSRPPVTRRRTCRTPEGPEAPSRRPSTDVLTARVGMVPTQANLPQPDWINLLAPTLATNSQMPLVHTVATNWQGFYRLLIQCTNPDWDDRDRLSGRSEVPLPRIKPGPGGRLRNPLRWRLWPVLHRESSSVKPSILPSQPGAPDPGSGNV